MKAKEVMEVLGISRPTLCTYLKKGLIKIDAEVNGQYSYNEESVYSLGLKSGKTLNSDDIQNINVNLASYYAKLNKSLDEIKQLLVELTIVLQLRGDYDNGKRN